MSVRKRSWVTASGISKEAWVVDYVDQKGTRRLKTFDRKKQADDFASTASVEVRAGVHVADSASATVRQAGELWIAAAEADALERSTLAQYRQHLDLHIGPFIGETLLSKLSLPAVREFEDTLKRERRSPALRRKVRTSLGSLLADAQERGLVARNVVRDLSHRRRKGKEAQSERRQRGKLKIGLDIPTPAEIKSMIASLTGRWRPILLSAIFTGLRASELRGLPWADVDFELCEIHVRQRADRYNKIGPPKSVAGERNVPMPPIIVRTLREWKLACPKGEGGLVFPNGAGKVESLANIINRGLIPLQFAANLAEDSGRRDGDGNPIMRARYSGLHALRHFYASWCINRRQDGGLELPPKMVQERLGHSSIVMTMDIYGHLFPRGDDGAEMEAAERALLA